MSAKWRRSLAWDDRFFPAWAWPVKFTLRAFSSIWLAVILLTLVCLYSILASIPLGLLVNGVQWLNALLALVIPVGLGIVLVHTVSKRLLATAAVALVIAAAWWFLLWPKLSPVAHEGASWRMFDDLARAYASVTIRRLPAVEMTELEFYSAWPLKLILGLFVLNMIVATLRRIEFTFLNLGVLTVHTGIVLLALGSVYYQGLKKEGDILLHASPTATGKLAPGPAATTFYDNTSLTLYVRENRGWEQRYIDHVPRYNDYALGEMPAAPEAEGSPEGTPEVGALELARRPLFDPSVDDGRTLDLPVPASSLGQVDDDITFRLVGYATYCKPQFDWIRAEPPMGASPADLNPLRIVYLTIGEEDTPDFSFILLPNQPAKRISLSQLLGLEYTLGMDDRRFAALSEPLPRGVSKGLVVEVPETGDRVVLPARTDASFEVGGYRLTIESLLDEPPFPIITEGYQGATSSVALIRIETPEGESYTRYAYHRFPEIDQDILAVAADGRPTRRDADPSIGIAYIDASRLQVFLDEDPDTGRLRSIVRLPGGQVRTQTDLPPDARLDDVLSGFEGDSPNRRAPVMSLEVAHRWAHARSFERPVPVPKAERIGRFIGTHDEAMLAVEIKADRSAIDPVSGRWSTVVWLPFTRYLGSEAEKIRTIDVPGSPGRTIQLAFGRRQHALSNFSLRLEDFEMIPYEHGGPPRDFRSVVRVLPIDPKLEPFTAEVSLNHPLRAPHREHTDAPEIVDFARRMVFGLSPSQLKLSQAGWDANTWRQSEAQIGQPGSTIEQPYVLFTILGVGNNPGISVIALGGVCMGLGIPWAFYVKPVVLKRRKARFAREASERARDELSNGDKVSSSLSTHAEPPVGVADTGHS